MHLHLVQVRLSSPSVTPLEPEQLDVWRAFLNAHAHVTRAIGRDLAAAGLPDLGWYDLLWTLYRAPERRLGVNEVARQVGLSPTAKSRFVDRAEAARVVRRGPEPAARPGPPAGPTRARAARPARTSPASNAGAR